MGVSKGSIGGRTHMVGFSSPGGSWLNVWLKPDGLYLEITDTETGANKRTAQVKLPIDKLEALSMVLDAAGATPELIEEAMNAAYKSAGNRKGITA